MEIKEIAKLCYKAAEDKKGERIKIIDISKISTVSDYMVVASGSNKNQIQAMADNVIENLHKEGIVPKSVEGYNTANWILIDEGDVVVHLFDTMSRDFYDIERLYQDGRYVEL